MSDAYDDDREVSFPPVEPFSDDLLADQRALALKVLEEASEVHGAWQLYDSWSDPGALEANGGPLTPEGQENVNAANHDSLLDEMADVVQAVANLAWALGEDDMAEAMRRCRGRNDERGRYDDGPVL